MTLGRRRVLLALVLAGLSLLASAVPMGGSGFSFPTF
jgi:hypothetical protein